MVFNSSFQDSGVTNLIIIHLLTHLANIYLSEANRVGTVDQRIEGLGCRKLRMNILLSSLAKESQLDHWLL